MHIAHSAWKQLRDLNFFLKDLCVVMQAFSKSILYLSVHPKTQPEKKEMVIHGQCHRDDKTATPKSSPPHKKIRFSKISQTHWTEIKAFLIFATATLTQSLWEKKEQKHLTFMPCLISQKLCEASKTGPKYFSIPWAKKWNTVFPTLSFIFQSIFVFVSW
mgnify:CR=1 FL=1